MNTLFTLAATIVVLGVIFRLARFFHGYGEKKAKEDALAGRLTGRLTKTFKTYGFIACDDAAVGENIFVHRSAADFTLREGQHLAFDVERGPKGLRAANVCIAE